MERTIKNILNWLEKYYNSLHNCKYFLSQTPCCLFAIPREFRSGRSHRSGHSHSLLVFIPLPLQNHQNLSMTQPRLSITKGRTKFDPHPCQPWIYLALGVPKKLSRIYFTTLPRLAYNLLKSMSHSLHYSSFQHLHRHILNCLVQNEPGVLSRVSGILAGRGFNIDSLVVCRTEIRDLSRMCIVLSGQDGVVEQARRQLEDLVRSFTV
jgi:acetolactate synthase regulatory subunit